MGTCLAFDTEYAIRYGVDEAIFLNNIIFWIRENKKHSRNLYDGRTWTFNSAKSYSAYFPFWSEQKIWRIADSLVKKGVLVKGNYNKSGYDRTLWFAFADESIFLPEEIHLTEMKNRINRNVEPIPDINTDDKPHTHSTDIPSVGKKGKSKLRSQEYKDLYARLDEAFKKGYNCWSNGKPYPSGARENANLSTICSRYEQCPDIAMELVKKYYRLLMNRERFWDQSAFLPSGFVKNEARLVAQDSGLSGKERMQYNNGDLHVVEKLELK